MAHITVRFAVEMDLEVPDEYAQTMTLEDLCASVDLAAHGGGRNTPVVIGNELMPATFSWRIQPVGAEVLPETAEVFGLPGDGFDRLNDEVPEPLPQPDLVVG